jgi:hypothetical protein
MYTPCFKQTTSKLIDLLWGWCLVLGVARLYTPQFRNGLFDATFDYFGTVFTANRLFVSTAAIRVFVSCSDTQCS